MAKKLAKELYLHNNLKHINIKNDHDYSALFVVNTPITDNSGIAHCVEHLIFRASKAFPHATTLFQLTALTNVKINASTLADTTYFHCQSPCLESFNLALNYLLNGMFSPLFRQEDLNKEIHDGNDFGVIYRELIGLKNEAEQQDKQLINKNNAQANNSYNYSGDSQLIGKLSLNDLQNFHQQHYQTNNITLVTANANIEQVSRLISQLPTQQKPEESISVQKKISGTADDKQQKKYSPEINELISVYYQWLQDAYDKENNHQKTSPQKNHDCSKYENPTQPSVKQKVLERAVLEQTALNQTDKLTSSIESGLIAPLMTLSKTLEKQLLNYRYMNRSMNNKIIKNKAVTPPQKLKPKQALPHLFNPLYLKAKVQLSSSYLNQKQLDKNLVYVYDEHNALLLAAIDKTALKLVYIASYIINAYPSFLSPRCQGLCYATQALVIEEPSYLAIYSAFDCTPKVRLKTIIQSLLQLSQDTGFIQKSLLLAKIKYCCMYQVEIHNLNDITPLSISIYLLTLTNKAPSKV